MKVFLNQREEMKQIWARVVGVIDDGRLRLFAVDRKGPVVVVVEEGGSLEVVRRSRETSLLGSVALEQG